MNIVVLSGDNAIADATSSAYNRMYTYSQGVDHMHIITRGNAAQESVITQDTLSVYIVKATSKIGAFWKYLRTGLSIIKKISKENDVVITAQDPFFFGALAVVLSRLAGGVPVEIQVHGDLEYIVAKSWIRYIMSRYTIMHSQSIRVVSEKNKEYIATQFPLYSGNVAVLPVLVDATPFRKIASFSLTPHILVVSRLEKEKNIQEALHICKDILAHVPTARLRIAGQGSREQELLDTARSLDIDTKVEFLGFRKDIDEVYADSQILLHTAPAEGFGLVFVEAGLSALPIIGYKSGILPEISDMYAVVGDRDALVRYATAILSDASLWKEHSERVHARAQKYIMTPDVYRRSLVGLWRNMLSS